MRIYKLVILIGYSLLFLTILILEIIKANIEVAMIILNYKKSVESIVIEHKSRLKMSFLRTILGNSITLTPGTVTLELDEDVYTIHCLEKKFISGIEKNPLEDILCRVEALLNGQFLC